ncbi:MAG: ankyrin repeat domain-containing protein [Desulfomonilaceae bacterium]
MTMRSTHVSRGIKGLLALSPVLVLFPLCDMATAGDKNRVLILASMKGDVKKVISLLNSGVDVNVKDQRGWTALSIAAGKGDQEMELLLRARGAKQ